MKNLTFAETQIIQAAIAVNLLNPKTLTINKIVQNGPDFVIVYPILLHSFIPEFNLPPIGAFTLFPPPGPYTATTCRERELTLDHIGLHTFLTTQGHGGSPRMRDQLNAGVTNTNTKDDTHHACTHLF